MMIFFFEFLHGIESFKFLYSIIFLLVFSFFISFFAPIDRIIRSFDLKPRLGDLICWRLE